MELHELLSYIEQYGYWALFFCLWLGIIGMPIPDEMIVMSGGFVSSLGILNVIPAFLLTYLGVVSGLSLGYILGKIFGTKVLDKLMKRKSKVCCEIARDGREVWSLCISYKLLHTSCKTCCTVFSWNE